MLWINHSRLGELVVVSVAAFDTISIVTKANLSVSMVTGEFHRQ